MDATPLTGMTANQQFVLALLGLLVAPIVTLVSLWFTRRTFHQVNSRMDEYKSVLAEESKKAVDAAVTEMKRLLALESAVQVVAATGGVSPMAPASHGVVAATAETVTAAKHANDLAKKSGG